MEKILDMTLLIVQGAEVTLEIFFVTLILSLPIGALAALGRISSFAPMRYLMEFYVWIMRGTPLMLQLLFVYFALPMVGIMLPDVAAALLALLLLPTLQARKKILRLLLLKFYIFFPFIKNS